MILFIECLIIIGVIIYFTNKKPTTATVNSNQTELIKGFPDLETYSITANFPKEEQSVILKEPSFNVNAIKEYTGKEIKKFAFFVPQTWNEFIAQDEAKDMANVIIKQINRGMKGHIFISSSAGMGKTTFINIFTKELKANLITRIGRMIEEEELVNIINEINSNENHTVLFVDEIETCNPKILKIFNPLIESFEISGKRIKPFTFCCASINKHSLIKTNPDLLDRITNHIHFKQYSTKDIVTIIKQYKKNSYPTEKIPENIYKSIADNGKYNPRISIPLLEKYITIQDINKVLKCMRIVENGLTEKDIEILTILNNSSKPMGENALAIKAKLDRKEYALEFEPFLYQNDYINRIPSRVITNKGKKLLESLAMKQEV